jgi:hypothetical protein
MLLLSNYSKGYKVAEGAGEMSGFSISIIHEKDGIEEYDRYSFAKSFKEIREAINYFTSYIVIGDCIFCPEAEMSYVIKDRSFTANAIIYTVGELK